MDLVALVTLLQHVSSQPPSQIFKCFDHEKKQPSAAVRGYHSSKTAMSPAGFSSQWTSGVQEAWSAHSVSYPRASLHYPAHHHLHHHPTHTSYAYCLRQPASVRGPGRLPALRQPSPDHL
ncbi:hypothetical protein J4Q44_G00059100 [Coregonus suidteri]|uniref:Uncharacterized protein n=1 Tax=Coregonus suidteri TaxID=861788 RepID=A0AAN8R3J5_9TELE